MDKRDLNLQLCSDDPIFVGGVPIYPIPISEIAKIGYMRFNAEVRLLCLNESDISAMTGNDISDIGVFKYLVANAMRDHGLMDTILFWLFILLCVIIESQNKIETTGLWTRFCFGSLLSRIAE